MLAEPAQRLLLQLLGHDGDTHPWGALDRVEEGDRLPV
jgi:hypothetical protein